MPTRIHPQALALAHSLFDVITPADPRAPVWPTLAVAAVVRTGKITPEELRMSAGKLRIITRNGELSMTYIARGTGADGG